MWKRGTNGFFNHWSALPDIPMIALPKDAPYAVEPLVGTPYDMVLRPMLT